MIMRQFLACVLLFLCGVTWGKQSDVDQTEQNYDRIWREWDQLVENVHDGKYDEFINHLGSCGHYYVVKYFNLLHRKEKNCPLIYKYVCCTEEAFLFSRNS